jgi:Ser/Thr protein kinase RdoA (MazF antagonist)
MPAFNILAALAPTAHLLHQRKRLGGLYEKRVVATPRQAVLSRFPLPGAARHLSQLLHHATECGAPVQTVLFCQDSWWQAMRHGGFWLALDYVPGTIWNSHTATPEQAQALGEGLARWHAAARPRAGMVLLPGSRNPTAFWQRWLGECRQVLEQQTAQTAKNTQQAPDRNAALHEWLAHSELPENWKGPFHLVHGDLYPKNVLVRTDGQGICLIDYEHAAFAPAGLELAATLFRLFRANKQGWSLRHTFLRAYLQACTPDIQQEWECWGPDLLILAQLHLAWRRLRRARWLEGQRQATAAKTRRKLLRHHLAVARALLKAHQRGVQDPLLLLEAAESAVRRNAKRRALRKAQDKAGAASGAAGNSQRKGSSLKA